MRIRWRNKTLTERGAKLMEEAVRYVEDKIRQEAHDAIMKDEKPPEPPHLPTVINDRLFPHCIAVAVVPNAGEGSCFRGMECAQIETMGKVYNVALVLRPEP
ncbi:unnamed protein product [Vitrella brassicaformis CCMP3155]|uniref:Uncharacterized protein n=2 Tax=Vitrella brassicaformis TaxID=1169539 RepID=A0A0G4FW56_VITBC|nr:unnamed protein product [Vitrella brassicaformis CCMP3155]|mmetsp:Transcript_49564/g.124274  ORF Transcript_49564/g.124274 Transcript_49564/m.124274 type:complete len:102 (+) Transcript_49564:106-411(+)|eukprot:CEM18875.1 unnamed protein product [Vitrella brassicaformis CCMP3155]